MFANKLFTYLTCAYLKKKKVFKYEIFSMLSSYEDEDFGRSALVYLSYNTCFTIQLLLFSVNDTLILVIVCHNALLSRGQPT